MDICINCGCTLTDCNVYSAQCEEDAWVQPQDFDNPDLDDYIKLACDKLEVTRDQLHKIVVENDEKLYDELIVGKFCS